MSTTPHSPSDAHFTIFADAHNHLATAGYIPTGILYSIAGDPLSFGIKYHVDLQELEKTLVEFAYSNSSEIVPVDCDISVVHPTQQNFEPSANVTLYEETDGIPLAAFEFQNAIRNLVKESLVELLQAVSGSLAGLGDMKMPEPVEILEMLVKQAEDLMNPED